MSFINETTAANYSSPKSTNISWQECQSIYNRPYVFGNGRLLIVTPQTEIVASFRLTNETEFYNAWPVYPDSSLIKLGNQIKWNTALQYVGSVSINEDSYFDVSYCISEPMLQFCKVEFSAPIIVIVIICNISKVVCMALTVWYCKESKLVTLGDTIASFLENPDLTTKSLCLMSKEDVDCLMWTQPKKPRKWEPIRERAFYRANIRRWNTVNLWYVI